MYDSIEDVNKGGGACAKHGCVCRTKAGAQSADLVVIGAPCQPYSRMRSGKSSKPPHRHECYGVLWNDFFNFLTTSRPRGGVCEQVLGFLTPYYEQDDDITPTVPLQKFVEKLRLLGYETLVLKLDALMWLGVPRERFLGR